MGLEGSGSERRWSVEALVMGVDAGGGIVKIFIIKYLLLKLIYQYQ